MKPIIQNIDEMKDSREILESKPHPFTTILFIYYF
ncbi:bacteriocin ABC transporter bacteriocin-binding protein [Clostridium sporogenes]|nr:bacteriocin ABC transporter bacteriocin-binding protein [Clostridium sporogenes]SUY94564.1 bacteriocin ABC transporter bacteriocin-binding protein [Clostridium sporogenes]